MGKAEIGEYFKKKGGLDLLAELSEGIKSFNDLEDALPLSPNTVLSRLREAQDLGLVGARAEGGRGKPRILYELTKTGEEALEPFQPILETYLERREELEQLEERAKEKTEEINVIKKLDHRGALRHREDRAEIRDLKLGARGINLREKGKEGVICSG